MTKEEIDGLGVPIQIQAPEIDPIFTADLKKYANTVIPSLGLQYEYLYLPGTEHGFATRGDTLDAKAMLAMKRGMGAAANWFRFWLKDEGNDAGMTVAGR